MGFDLDVRFGKRYLRSDEFVRLCKSVALYWCSENELEEYEREGWMFPAVRLVMPEEYARAIGPYFYGKEKVVFDERYLPFHKVYWATRYSMGLHQENWRDEDLHHPIDVALGKVEGLEKPIDTGYRPWSSYVLSIEYEGRSLNFRTATHFYHYWQVYELYQVRKKRKGMYLDKVLLPELGPWGEDRRGVHLFLDAVSYFQHLYSAYRSLLFQSAEGDADGWVSLDKGQQAELESAGHDFSQETLSLYDLDESYLYAALHHLMELHYSYSEAERVRLSEALKADIWRAAELIYFATGASTEEISERAGRVGRYFKNYFEVLFPNRRKEVRTEARRIVGHFVQEYNRSAPSYSLSNQAIEDLFTYIENTSLAWFEYVVVEMNRAWFDLHSWHTAETFLLLKSLASFPESLMRTLILTRADKGSQKKFHSQRNAGMGTLNTIVFGNLKPSILKVYESIGHYRAKSLKELESNLSFFEKNLAAGSTKEEHFLGVNLALATLLRNFTSHFVVEEPTLLRGQYARSVRSLFVTVFAIWRIAKNKGWV